MATAIFRVQVVDRETGSDRWLEVPASSRDEASRTVSELGEIVGRVELLRVGSAPSRHGQEGGVSAAAIPAPVTWSAVPGAMPCPKCSGCRWKSGYQAISIVLAIILFPIGLLALLMPRVHRCLGCSYTYYGGPDPPSEGEGKSSSIVNIFIGLLVAFVVISMLAVVLKALRDPH